MSREDETARLRRCRETFELAVRAGLSMADARDELARRRWQESEARLAARRCGTRIDEPTHGPAPIGARWMMAD